MAESVFEGKLPNATAAYAIRSAEGKALQTSKRGKKMNLRWWVGQIIEGALFSIMLLWWFDLSFGESMAPSLTWCLVSSAIDTWRDLPQSGASK